MHCERRRDDSGAREAELRVVAPVLCMRHWTDPVGRRMAMATLHFGGGGTGTGGIIPGASQVTEFNWVRRKDGEGPSVKGVRSGHWIGESGQVDSIKGKDAAFFVRDGGPWPDETGELEEWHP